MPTEDIQRFIEQCAAGEELKQAIRDKLAKPLGAITKLGASNGYDFNEEEFSRFIRDSYLEPLSRAEGSSERSQLVALCMDCLDQGSTGGQLGREFQTIQLGTDSALIESLKAHEVEQAAEQASPVETPESPQGTADQPPEPVRSKPQAAEDRSAGREVAAVSSSDEGSEPDDPNEDLEDDDAWVPNKKPWWKIW